MARPNKEGLDYFPFDIDFFNDQKIEFVSAKYGIEGEIITIKLMCKIYRNGYYLKWGEDECLLFSKKVGENISTELVTNVINELLKRRFFSKGLYEKYQILTSNGIQKRYFNSVKTRKIIFVIKEYLVNGTSDYLDGLVNIRFNSIDTSINRVNIRYNSQSKEKNSKEKKEKESKEKKEKESKEKESKEKESKEKESKENILRKESEFLTVTPTTTPNTITSIKHVKEKDTDAEKRKLFKDNALSIFNYYKKILKHPNAKFTPDRERKIIARLKEGYTLKDCFLAIDGCSKNEWNMGKNDKGVKYDSINLIFRNGDNIEKFKGYNFIVKNRSPSNRVVPSEEKLKKYEGIEEVYNEKGERIK